MTRTEMTQGQWKPVGILAASEVDPTNPSGFRGDDLPIESITSEQAESYAERLSELTGVVVRIPTSAEWQHAAAGGATGPFQQMEEAELEKVAWYEKNSGPTTHPVGTKEPNAYNISDIFGNVFELVSVAPGSYEIRGGCWCYKDFWCTPDYPSLWPANKKEQGVGLRLVHQPATD